MKSQDTFMYLLLNFENFSWLSHFFGSFQRFFEQPVWKDDFTKNLECFVTTSVQKSATFIMPAELLTVYLFHNVPASNPLGFFLPLQLGLAKIGFAVLLKYERGFPYLPKYEL